MNTPDPKLIDKITKLLALSKDGGATEAEASLAAEMAQRIMAEHNLSMAAIEAQGGSTGADGKRDAQTFENKTPYKWCRSLMAAVGKLNFCHVTERWESRGMHRHARTSTFAGFSVIGRASNVAATQVMYGYLVQSINRAASSAVDNDPTQLWTRFAASFREGCADRLQERLAAKLEQIIEEQERKAREQNATARHPSAAPGTGLVVVLRDVVQSEEDLNNDFRMGLEPGTTAARRAKRQAEQAAYEIERQAKYNAAIARGMTHEEAYFVSIGYSDELARQLGKPVERKPETDAQRRKRQEQNDRYWERQRQRDERAWAKKDARGYFKGQEAGDTIGLDPQVGGSHTVRLK